MTSDTSKPSTSRIIIERLLADIVSGKRRAGARLPGERELASKLGVSRATLRDVYRRLEDWRVVRARRGVGTRIRPYRDWSIEVITTYLQFGRPNGDQPTLDAMMVDTLAMRRTVILEVIRLAAPRIPIGALDAARRAAVHAWTLRGQPSFADAELDVVRELANAARATPCVWLLNRMRDDALSPMWLALRAPDDYVSMYARFFELLESGDGNSAVEWMRLCLERRDAALIAALRDAT